MCNIAGYVGEKQAAPILIEMLRRETKFDSLDELSLQIARDTESAKISLKKEGYTL